MYSINRAPDCTAAFASPAVIWPADHRPVAIVVGGVTDRDGDPVEIAVTRILQDEPTEARGGDTRVDAGGLGSSTPWVRGERLGGGDGRVYELNFAAVDRRGGRCAGTVVVGVPLDQGKRKVPVNSPPRYDSTTGIRIR